MPLFWKFDVLHWAQEVTPQAAEAIESPMFVTVLWSKRHLRNFLSKISMMWSLLEVINALDVCSYLFNPKSGSKSQSDLQATNPIYSRHQIPLWCHLLCHLPSSTHLQCANVCQPIHLTAFSSLISIEIVSFGSRAENWIGLNGILKHLRKEIGLNSWIEPGRD